jgi:probable HAF family extracellular repeat protein
LWRDGKMLNLGTIGTDRDSEATSINSRGQVVGESGTFGVADLHGWLWQRSGPIIDLNALVVAGDKLSVISATQINDRGEIAGVGALPNGDTHAIVLIPCDAEHPGLAGCDYHELKAPNGA